MEYGRLSSRDWELISAYLDGQLANKNLTRFQSRLKTDPEFSAAFEEMKRTKSVLRSAPKLRAPRNYMLKPDMVEVRSKRGFSLFKFSSFSFASAVTGLLLLVLLVSDLLGMVHQIISPIPHSGSAPSVASELVLETAEIDAALEEESPVEEPQLGIQEMEPMGTPSETEGPMMALRVDETPAEGEAEDALEEAVVEEQAEEMAGAASTEFGEPGGGGGEPPQLGPTPTPTLEIEAAAEATLEEDMAMTEVAIEPEILPSPPPTEGELAAAELPEEKQPETPGQNALGLFIVRMIEVTLAAMTIVFLILGWIYQRQKS